MNQFEQVEALIKNGQRHEALDRLVKLVTPNSSPSELVSVANTGMCLNLDLAKSAAETALRIDSENIGAMGAYAEVLARQGQFEEAEIWFLRTLPSLTPLERKRWVTSTSCPACGHLEATAVDVRDLRRFVNHRRSNLPDPFRVWARCNQCSLIRVRDSPTNEARSCYSESPELIVSMPPTIDQLQHELVLADASIDLIEKFAKGGRRLFEIGPHWGSFLAAAEQRGFDAVGLDQDKRSAEWATDTLGVKVVIGAAPKDLPDESFDAVVAFEVIEHCQHQNALFEGMAACTEKSGVLVLSTPFFDHPIHGYLGYDDPMLVEFDHVVYYERSTLAAALERVGFTIIHQWTSSRHFGSVGVIAKRI